MSDTSLPLPVPSAELRERLSLRRSTPAQALAAPGPSPEQITDILHIGARTPDHGKLFPWRFVVMGPRSRAEITAQLEPLAERQPDARKARAVLAKLANPPATILVVSTPTPGHKVPVWEQELSAGAVCMNLSHAANALGFATNWITDWYAYDPEALAMFGVGQGEKIAGFIHIGTAAEAPLERPRPEMTDKVTTLP